MPQIQYPFIDIAVHPAVRARFAAGEAVALFSRDMTQVLWANGEGAKLFGYSDIYDLLDDGPDRSGVAFRQLAATARQLEEVGDRRSLMMRVTAGFVSQVVSAEVTLVEIRSGEIVVIFSAAVAGNSTFQARVAALLKGFDDPDTHMAVVDDQGTVLAASPGFDALGIAPETSRSLIAAVSRGGENLIKRPIASAAGYLPAAVGKLSIDPPLNLLFCVETVLGRMDPPQDVAKPLAAAAEGAFFAADTVISGSIEPDVSLSGLDEPEELPVEGMIETVSENEPDFHDASASVDAFEQSAAAPLAEANTVPAQDVDGFAEASETTSTVEDLGSAAASDDITEISELAANQAEATAGLTETDVLEPEDHVEAEMAEAVLNEGESPDDVKDLADLDGASVEAIDAYALVGENQFGDAVVSGISPDVSASPGLAEDKAEAESIPQDDPMVIAPEEYVETDGPGAGEMVSLPEDDNAVFEAAPETATALASAVAPAMFEGNDTSSETRQQVVADVQPAAEEPAQDGTFHFRRDGRPVRFIWKLDAQGRFSEVSDEFARTIGPHAGNINGMSYRDLNNLFNLDPENEITALLERRDTWSGRTIRWPIEGTDLLVPIDLAALPTYSRNREFDGFRGFGIIRIADVEPDPHAIGLTLGDHQVRQEPAQSVETVDDITAKPEHASDAVDAETRDATDADDVPLTIDGQFDNLHVDDDAIAPALVDLVSESYASEMASSADTAPEAVDEFRGEVPALKFDSSPLTELSEKVIQLEERRARAREGLSPTEQNAFREIARQLEPFGKRPNEVLFEQSKDTPPAEAISEPSTTEKSTAEQSTEAALDDALLAAEDVEAGSLHDDAIVDAEPEHHVAEDEADEADVAGDVGLTASAADQIPLAILIHAGDRLIYANSEFKRFSGYDSLEALDAAGGLDALITRKEGPEAGVYTMRADGSEVPVSARLQSVRYEGAKLLMLTLAQVEPAVRAEDTLAEDHEAARRLSALKVEADELRSILETATDGVVVLDVDGRIRSMNRSASALFNFEDAETRGKPFAMLFAHESQKAVQDYLNGLIGHGVASVLNDGREVIGREASGGFIPLFMTMGRMPGSNSYCAVIRDITQWKRSEEELKSAKRSAETANQHKSDFLARVSHEIRTPLNAIIGFSDMIASEHFGPAGHARYVEYAHDIGRSGRHVLDIVNDLLDISKIEAGEMDLEFAAVGLNDCVSEAVTLVQPQANAQRVIIRTSLSQSVPNVVADLRSVKQIAINILANAIRFTPSGGQIVVSTAYEPSGSVALRIRDTGVGMSKADLEQAMKPFGQVSPGARHRGDGTGLGLPLTRAMTEANRALFSIQSSPNEGTLVEITFPPQRVLAD